VAVGPFISTPHAPKEPYHDSATIENPKGVIPEYIVVPPAKAAEGEARPAGVAEGPSPELRKKETSERSELRLFLSEASEAS
jgi:hypothetical protein